MSQYLKTLLLAFVLSVGLSYVSAWTGPTQSPPNGNTPAPVNVGSASQTKTGILGAHSLIADFSSDATAISWLGNLIAGGGSLSPSAPNSSAWLNLLKNTGQLLVGWNRTSGGGEIDLIGNRGSLAGATGGFNFYDLSNGGLITNLLTLTGDGKVGIGTANPVGKLQISGVGVIDYLDSIPTLTTESVANGGTGDRDFRIKTTGGNVPGLTIKATSGNVGIGTTGPQFPLVVNGSVSNFTADIAAFTAGASGQGGGPRQLRVFKIDSSTGGIGLQSQDIGDSQLTNPSSRQLLLNPSGGNVGIGTTNPLDKLEVYSAPAAGRSQISAHSNSTTNTSYGAIAAGATNGRALYMTVGDSSVGNDYWVHAGDATIAATANARLLLRAGGTDAGGITIGTDGNTTFGGNATFNNVCLSNGCFSSWPAGPAGPQGPAGAAGPQGPPGPGFSNMLSAVRAYTSANNDSGNGWPDYADSAGSATNATNATYGRYVYNNGAYFGSGWVEPSSLGVYYSYLGRLVYNNGAYSGTGWVEPSDLGVRYAATAGSANYASSAGSAPTPSGTICGFAYDDTGGNCYNYAFCEGRPVCGGWNVASCPSGYTPVGTGWVLTSWLGGAGFLFCAK